MVIDDHLYQMEPECFFAENREGGVKVTFSLSYNFLPMIYEFRLAWYYGAITAVNKISSTIPCFF
ncbi:MAG: hypothetical protein A2170_05975 [Deltaproteobacteria bacterium RBG_13_53_10]|nr:MAG: hypothetical protein A2170_05975 [Deltaproteobacteria bacterium RBG_13_53_10]